MRHAGERRRTQAVSCGCAAFLGESFSGACGLPQECVKHEVCLKKSSKVRWPNMKTTCNSNWCFGGTRLLQFRLHRWSRCQRIDRASRVVGQALGVAGILHTERRLSGRHVLFGLGCAGHGQRCCHFMGEWFLDSWGLGWSEKGSDSDGKKPFREDLSQPEKSYRSRSLPSGISSHSQNL